MVIAELRLAHPDFPLTPTLQAVSGVTIHREFQPVRGEADLFLFFSVTADNLEHLDTALEADPTVTTPHQIADLGDQRMYRVHITDAAQVTTPTLAQLGIQILDVRSQGASWVLRLQLPDREALVEFRNYCVREGITFDIRTLYLEEDRVSEGSFGLTEDQRDALTIAFENGYFNDPRDLTLQELAAEMDISSAALGRRLRRAITNLISHTVRPPDD